MNVYETLSEAARQWPRRPAVIDGAGTVDYASLWREIENLRVQLGRLGVRDGEGVGVQVRNSRAMIVSALAALGCGAVVMPIYHLLKPDEMAEVLSRVPLAAIISDGDGGIQCVPGAVTIEMLQGAPLCFSRLLPKSQPLVPWVDEAAFLRFTSGTTGTAKGVILTHSGVIERIRAANGGLCLGCEDKVLCVLPMAYHFFVSIVLYLAVGAAIVISPNHLAGGMLEAANAHRATFLYVAPMHIGLLAADRSGLRFPASVRTIMSVSSRLDPNTAQAFRLRHGLPVAQGYGIIEVGLPIINIEDAERRPDAIGRPLREFDAAILGDSMDPVLTGLTGQLAVRGPGMFAGYLSPPLACAQALQNGWFLTGDLAHADDTGLITIDGRIKSVINVAGHKVFPEDVAEVLDQHPAVWRTRVTTRKHPRLGEVLHAEVQLREPRQAVAVEELLLFCRRRLSGFKVPASVEFVHNLDLTPSGKVRHG